MWHERKRACVVIEDENIKRGFDCEGIGRHKEKCLEDDMKMRSCAWSEERSTCYHQDRCSAHSGMDEEKCAQATALGLGCVWHRAEGCINQEAMDGCFLRFG